MVIGAGGCSAPEVGCEPADKVVVKVSLGDFGKELVMWDAVKSFGKIYCNCCGSCRGFQLIESLCNRRGQWEKGGGC